MTLREQLHQHIQAHNRHLEDMYLYNLPFIHLLRLCHPIYRADYARMAHREGEITEPEMYQFVKKY